MSTRKLAEPVKEYTYLAIWSVIVAVLVLAGAEWGLRWLAPEGSSESEQFRPPWMDDDTFTLWQEWVARFDAPLKDIADIGWQMDPVLRWSLRPNLALRARNIFIDPALGRAAFWDLQTNSRGFRGPEFQIEKPPGILRVVTLGDSNTMGWLLDDVDSYPRQLERYLAERLGRPVEVINLGIGGYTSFSAKQLFQREVLRLAPDALVVSVGANDAQLMGSTDADFAAGRSRETRRPFREWLGSLQLSRMLRPLVGSVFDARVQRVGPGDYGANLAAIFSGATAANIPVLFAQVCCCTADYQLALDQELSGFGIRKVDAFAAVREEYANGTVPLRYPRNLERVTALYPPEEIAANTARLFYYRDNCHLNPLGAEILANRLAAGVAEQIASSPRR